MSHQVFFALVLHKFYEQLDAWISRKSTLKKTSYPAQGWVALSNMKKNRTADLPQYLFSNT
jgi:hypothetical protein